MGVYYNQGFLLISINWYDYGMVLYAIIYYIMSKCYAKIYVWVIGEEIWWNPHKLGSSSWKLLSAQIVVRRLNHQISRGIKQRFHPALDLVNCGYVKLHKFRHTKLTQEQDCAQKLHFNPLIS